MKVLFEGGPLDGQTLDVEAGRRTWEVSIWEQENLFCALAKEPPKIPPKFARVCYTITPVGYTLDHDAVGTL